MKSYFITGIGTDIGKTVISAILTEWLHADYWKPVQAGNLDNTDTMKVKEWVGNRESVFHEEAYRLNNPLSPHAAAGLDGVRINMKDIKVPASMNKVMLIEGAGGLLVPLNEKDLVIDLILHTGAEVILISRNYLGSINHTLLSAEALKSRGLKVKGIIFNGPPNPEGEKAILRFSGLEKLFHIPELEEINKEQVSRIAEELKKKYATLFN